MRLVFLCREQPWRDDSGAVMRNYQLALGLSREHRVTLVTFSKPELPRNPRYDTLRDACEDIVEVPQATCVFSQTHRFAEWASSTARLGVLLSPCTPRSIARWHSAEFVAALRSLRMSGDFDAVVASRPALAGMSREAGFPRVLVDLPDLESAMMQRELSSTP